MVLAIHRQVVVSLGLIAYAFKGTLIYLVNLVLN